MRNFVIGVLVAAVTAVVAANAVALIVIASPVVRAHPRAGEAVIGLVLVVASSLGILSWRALRRM
jgi:hypothetical protein